MASTPPRQREKYAPKPKPTDECQCTRATAAKSFGEVTHQFPYQSADGVRLFSRFRYRVTDPASTEGEKTFRYCPCYDRTNPVHVSLPYGLPRIKEAIKLSMHQPNHRIYLVEGEPDCEAAWALADAYATTTHLGTRFPVEVAQHFEGYQGKIVIVIDRDHMDPDHKARFEHEDEKKRKDYPGSASALRRARAIRSVGAAVWFREATKGKDMRDHLEGGRAIDDLRRVKVDTIKERAPREAGNKRSTTLQLSQADMPEGPGMLRFIQALEAKSYLLEKIGPTRYKTNCPHPEHDDHNPSFEFEQGTKGVVATCESYDCTVGDGMKEIAEALGIKVKDLFDEQRGRPRKEQPPKPDDSDTFCPDPGDPMEVARHIQNEWVNKDDGTVGIMYANEDTWLYRGTHWESVLDGTIRSKLYHRMDNEYMLKLIEEEWKPVRWAPAPAKIGALLESVRAINSRDELPEPNTWQGPPEFTSKHVAMRNGIFDIEAREMRDHTPRYFNTWSLPFDYDPDAKCPQWLEFLADVFEGDPESIRTLRQFLGMFISGRTDLEKILALIGPSRSGKGTIADMIEALMGPSSVEAFTLKHLAGEFGLQNLVGKSVMIAADSRAALKAEDQQAAIERLLSLSANDKLVINRKNQRPLSMRLGVRPVIMSNELPSFMDSSNAINQRMVMLKMRKSYVGREDITLKKRVLSEVQGVFNWALGGLDDLNETGKLLQPASAQNYIDTLDEGASPHEQFLSLYCEIGQVGTDDDFWCYHPELVQLWKSYCEQNNMNPSNPNWLPRKLAPVVTRLGGELGKGWHTDEKGTSFRTMTGIRIKEAAPGPKNKTAGLNLTQERK
ncbi:DNA primase/helicase [Streptomyces phage Dryad]|nr:DNA primase/helicase [Streptomyces phage Dryad]